MSHQKRWHEMRWAEMRWEKLRWDEMRWSLECEVWFVKSVVRSVEFQVWHLDQWSTFAQSTQSRASLAHGACKFCRWYIYIIYIYIWDIHNIFKDVERLWSLSGWFRFFRQLVSACCKSPVNLHPVAHRRSARGFHGERLGITRVDDWCLWCQGTACPFQKSPSDYSKWRCRLTTCDVEGGDWMRLRESLTSNIHWIFSS